MGGRETMACAFRGHVLCRLSVGFYFLNMGKPSKKQITEFLKIGFYDNFWDFSYPYLGLLLSFLGSGCAEIEPGGL